MMIFLLNLQHLPIIRLGWCIFIYDAVFYNLLPGAFYYL